MKTLRLATGVSLTAIVLFAGARAGGARVHHDIRPPAAAIAGEYPGGSGAIPLGESLEVAGQPMQLSLFSTSDPPRQVARFYAEAFRARGLTPILSVDADLAHVAAFDPGDTVQRFVTALAQPGGGALVMAGSTHTRMPPRFVSAPEGASFPLPPGHRGFLAFRSVDAGSIAESAQFVTALPPRAVATFYRASLAADGYSETPDGAGEGLLTFARRGITISVAIQRLGGTAGAAVFVTRGEAVAQ